MTAVPVPLLRPAMAASPSEMHHATTDPTLACCGFSHQRRFGQSSGCLIWPHRFGAMAWRRRGALEGRSARAVGPIEQAGREEERTATTFDLVLERFEDGGYETAVRFMAPIRDLGSLQALREAIRGRCALVALEAEYEQVEFDFKHSRERILKKVKLQQSIELVYMYEMRFHAAFAWLMQALESSRSDAVPVAVRNRIIAVLGILAMRRGEIEYCLECASSASSYRSRRSRRLRPLRSPDNKERPRRSATQPARHLPPRGVSRTAVEMSKQAGSPLKWHSTCGERLGSAVKLYSS